MLPTLIDTLKKQIAEGHHEEAIEDITMTLIAGDEFSSPPEDIQDAIYQLNTQDINELTKQYKSLLNQLADNV